MNESADERAGCRHARPRGTAPAGRPAQASERPDRRAPMALPERPARRQRARVWRGGVLALAALLGSVPPALAQPKAATDAHPGVPAAALPAATGGPSQVLVGGYLYFVQGLDTRANTFVADLYLWFLWSGDSDPTKTVEFMNALGPPTKTPIYTDDAGNDTPQTLPDGRKYQQYHIQGTFGTPLNFAAYPLDRHTLTIEIDDTKSTVDDLVYVVDAANTNHHGGLDVPGWVCGRFTGLATRAEYRTNFGDPREDGSVQYAHVTFGLGIERPRPGALIEGLTPVIITMLVGLGALFLRGDEFGTRLAMYATAVMTVVFLNMDLAAKVPEGASTLLRQITGMCFLVLVLLSFAGIRSLRLTESAGADAARRFDRLCFGAALGCFVLSCVAVLWGSY